MAFKRICISLIALALSAVLFHMLGLRLLYSASFDYLYSACVSCEDAGRFGSRNSACYPCVGGRKLSILLNEVLILVIPVTIALIVNLYMPNSEQKLMKKKRKSICP